MLSLSILLNRRSLARMGAALSLVVVSYTASAAPSRSELDQRLTALEIRIENNAARVERLERSNTSDVLMGLTQRLEQLEQENAELRNALEENQNLVMTLQENQRQLGIDIDRRFEGVILDGDGANQAVTPQPVVSKSRPVADPAVERQLYEKAFGYLRSGKHSQAIGTFQSYLKKYPKGRFADNSQYWLSEGYYVTRDFDQAKSNFNKLIKKYPRSKKVPDAMLKLGYTYYELGDKASAKKHLAAVIKKYPTSNAAKLAKNRLLSMG